MGWWCNELQDDRIAEALADRCPDRVLDMWKRLAEKQIAPTKPQAYELAASYLRKVRRVLESLGRKKEWQSYLAIFRQLNPKKKRLLEVFDSLSGRQIVESP